MLKPENVMKLFNAKEIFEPLEEARFIRIALFETPESPRIYNGLGVQLAGNDMYGKVILLKTLECTRDISEYYPENTVLFVAEWTWNGGQDLEGEQLEEAKKLYNNLLLLKINTEISKLSTELCHLSKDLQYNRINTEKFDREEFAIYKKASELWLNQYPGSRFPEWFEDLKVPENMKDMFNDAFGDFAI